MAQNTVLFNETHTYHGDFCKYSLEQREINNNQKRIETKNKKK